MLGEKVQRLEIKKAKYICRVSKQNTRQNGNFAQCQNKTLGKLLTLPSVGAKHQAKYNFAECPTRHQAMPNGRLGGVCRNGSFAECLTLPSAGHQANCWFAECWVPGTRQTTDLPSVAVCLHQANHLFAVCCLLPRVTLGKSLLCRVSDIKHQAKHLTLGKALISCSGGLVQFAKSAHNFSRFSITSNLVVHAQSIKYKYKK